MKKNLFAFISALLVFSVTGCEEESSVEQLSEFKVIYDKNNNDDGSTEPFPSSVMVFRPDKTVSTLPLIEPKRDGYSLADWNTRADGKGVKFTDKTIVSANITVYAQWNQYGYFVTFNKNNADPDGVDTAPIKKIVLPPNDTIDSLPDEPKRSAHYFVCWNTSPDGKGNQFDESSVVTEDMTVYAKWESGYAVTFDKNNASSESSEAIPRKINVIPPAETISGLPQPPSRQYYSFKEWNTKQDGTGGTFTANTPVEKGITVYAQWNFSGGIPTIAGNVLVIENPLMEKGPGFKGDISNIDGTINYSAGHIQLKFPSGNGININDYEYFEVHHDLIGFAPSTSSSSVSAGSGVVLRQFGGSATYNGPTGWNAWPWLINVNPITLYVSGAGSTGGFSIGYNGEPDSKGGYIKIKIVRIIFY